MLDKIKWQIPMLWQKINTQDLIDIKNTRLSGKNGITNILCILCHNESYVKKCNSIFVIEIRFDRILWFEVIVLSEFNYLIA